MRLNMAKTLINRRDVMTSLTALGALTILPKPSSALEAGVMNKKPIPKTGEELPVIGMGSWINFNVGDDKALRAQRTKVLKAFFDGGGGMVDSSPMYGSSQEVIGHMLGQLSYPKRLFSTTKVWTSLEGQGLAQVKQSMKLWGVNKFDLLQVHNLVAWKAHLEMLKTLKAEGLVRYIGITTSHGRRHDDFEAVMKAEPIDFIQLTYNIDNRAAETRLLPLAQDRGIAVIANRPFSRGYLVDKYAKHKLPDFAAEIDCANWPQFLLKFIVSHPALTVAIPATTRVEHVVENVGAGFGRMPDARLRREVAAYCASL